MKKIAVIFGVILSLTAAGVAQVNNRTTARAGRTVTNVELERYKQKRLTGEREYRENYAEMGFPSPDELEMQMQRSREEREELSAKLREERLERERIYVDRVRAEAELATAISNIQQDAGPGYQSFNGYGSYGGFGGYYGGYGYGYQGHKGYGGYDNFSRRFRLRSGFGPLLIPGYRATPAGVFSSPIRVPSFRGGIRSGRK